eukprot:31490-Pelagococcus_subviridis.AAC.8
MRCARRRRTRRRRRGVAYRVVTSATLRHYAEVVSRFPPASKIFIHASISSRRSPRPSRRPPRLADGRGASTP